MYVSGATARPQLTPPQYVRIIANAALFRERGVGAGGGGGRREGWGRGEGRRGRSRVEIQQVSSSSRSSSQSNANWLIIQTNYSPALSSYTSPSLSPPLFLPLHRPSSVSVCSATVSALHAPPPRGEQQLARRNMISATAESRRSRSLPEK